MPNATIINKSVMLLRAEKAPMKQTLTNQPRT